MNRYGRLAAVSLVAVLNSAAGETTLKACQKQIFEKLDRNRDGVLTPAEAAAEPMRMNARFFDISDRDGDGVLDFREYIRLGMFVKCEWCPTLPGCAKGAGLQGAVGLLPHGVDAHANLGELYVAGPSSQIQGMSLRVFDPKAGQWRIHWTNVRDGMVGEAMVGGFEGGVGTFFNEEELDGKTILARFVFSDILDNRFQIMQAFSQDDGETWETNWIARFTRTSGPQAEAEHCAANAIWAAIDQAWNMRKANQFSALFTDEAILEFIGREERMSGRPAIRENFTNRFPQMHLNTATTARSWRRVRSHTEQSQWTAKSRYAGIHPNQAPVQCFSGDTMRFRSSLRPKPLGGFRNFASLNYLEAGQGNEMHVRHGFDTHWGKQT